MTQHTYAHRLDYRIELTPGSDDRAPGGAVTVALCGHWDHDGACRWPHLSTMEADGDGRHQLSVEFDAPADELEDVKARIHAALTHGQLTGPDGRLSVWTVAE